MPRRDGGGGGGDGESGGKHCKGVIMIADILTKAVARQLFLQLLKLLDDYSINSIIDLQG